MLQYLLAIHRISLVAITNVTNRFTIRNSSRISPVLVSICFSQISYHSSILICSLSVPKFDINDKLNRIFVYSSHKWQANLFQHLSFRRVSVGGCVGCKHSQIRYKKKIRNKKLWYYSNATRMWLNTNSTQCGLNTFREGKNINQCRNGSSNYTHCTMLTKSIWLTNKT